MDWNIILKIATGLIIVPLAIMVHQAWPRWTNASLPVRILSGPIILPLAGLAAILTPWWESV